MAGNEDFFQNVLSAWNAPYELMQSQATAQADALRTQQMQQQLYQTQNIQKAMQQLWGDTPATNMQAAVSDPSQDPQSMQKFAQMAQILFKSGAYKDGIGALEAIGLMGQRTTAANKEKLQQQQEKIKGLSAQATSILSANDQSVYDEAYPNLASSLPQGVQLTGDLSKDTPTLKYLSGLGITAEQAAQNADRKEKEQTDQIYKGFLMQAANARLDEMRKNNQSLAESRQAQIDRDHAAQQKVDDQDFSSRENLWKSEVKRGTSFIKPSAIERKGQEADVTNILNDMGLTTDQVSKLTPVIADFARRKQAQGVYDDPSSEPDFEDKAREVIEEWKNMKNSPFKERPDSTMWTSKYFDTPKAPEVHAPPQPQRKGEQAAQQSPMERAQADPRVKQLQQQLTSGAIDRATFVKMVKQLGY